MKGYVRDLGAEAQCHPSSGTANRACPPVARGQCTIKALREKWQQGEQGRQRLPEGAKGEKLEEARIGDASDVAGAAAPLSKQQAAGSRV